MERPSQGRIPQGCWAFAASWRAQARSGWGKWGALEVTTRGHDSPDWKDQGGIGINQQEHGAPGRGGKIEGRAGQ